MDDRARRIRLRIRSHRRGKLPIQVRYPASLRHEAVAYARERRRQGVSLRVLAEEIGVCAFTLSRWLERAPRGTLRSVRVVPDPVTLQAPVLIGPQGFRVENLDVPSLVLLLRSLA